MKESAQPIAQRTEPSPNRNGRAGPKGAAIAPPAYGIGSVDQAAEWNGSTESVSRPAPIAVKPQWDGGAASSTAQAPTISWPTLVIKFAGSGDVRWRNVNPEKEIGAEETIEEKGRSWFGWTTTTSRTKYHRQDKGKSVFTIHGPDVFDRQTGNSIDQNVSLAIAEVTRAVQSLPEDRTLRLVVKGHSRGAVAAALFVKQVTENQELSNRIVLADAAPGPWRTPAGVVLFDPVPGPRETSKKYQIQMPEGVESTVVYSLHSGYVAFFDPMIVTGAKRVILTDHSHDAGMIGGFFCNEKRYRGSKLNALPGGYYVPEWMDGDLVPGHAIVPIKHVESAEATLPTLERAIALHPGNRDVYRIDNIRAALHLPPTPPPPMPDP